MTDTSATGAMIEELMQAVVGGNRAQVKRLLRDGADINGTTEHEYIGTMTPLLRAIIDGQNAEMVALLIDNGADMEVVRSYMDYTPLIQAVVNNRPEIVQLLLEKGADPDKKTTAQQTALDLAIERRDRVIEQILRNAPSRPRPPKPARQTGVTEKDHAHIVSLRQHLQGAAGKRPKVRLKRKDFPAP